MTIKIGDMATVAGEADTAVDIAAVVRWLFISSIID